MNLKDTLALAFLWRILLTNNNTTFAVVALGEYTSRLPQSYYPQRLSSYENENKSYFDNTDEVSPANGYHRQQFAKTSYGSSGGGYDEDQDSYQPQTGYQDYLGGNFSPFRQEQNAALDGYSHGGGMSALVSFDNIDFNNSETMNYQAPDDVIYPQAGSGTYQQHHKPPAQQYSQATDYVAANNNIKPSTSSRANTLESLSHVFDKERAASSTAQMLMAMNSPPTSARITQTNVHNQVNAQPYIETENQQDQHHTARAGEYDSQLPNKSDRLPDSSPSRTYYVADSDHSVDNSYHSEGASQSLSLLQSHLVQLPIVSSPALPAPAPPAATTFAISSEPIPISKHVEITKHVPVPVYRQIHVPFRKLVPIEIPRPVISTYPRPYPIQVPFTKTVAVPMVKEVKIPIEKVTPYPVEHRVPYVVEKRVPFQVERQVAAPIYYPFPVKVPMVRTILHKKKAHFAPHHYHSRYHV